MREEPFFNTKCTQRTAGAADGNASRRGRTIRREGTWGCFCFPCYARCCSVEWRTQLLRNAILAEMLPASHDAPRLCGEVRSGGSVGKGFFRGRAGSSARAVHVCLLRRLRGCRERAFRRVRDFRGPWRGFRARTDELQGVQFGLINVADSGAGLQIGLINSFGSDGDRLILPFLNARF